MFVDPDQGGFQVGTLGMGRMAWPAQRGRIDAAPVKEGEQRAVAVHDGISIDEGVHGLLVKLPRDRYDRGHEAKFLSK